MRGPSKKFDNWGNAMKRLQDKVCLVTGGANGLGNAIARRMTDEGASVLLLDKDPKGEKAAMDIGADIEAGASNRVSFIKCDVSKELDVKDAIDTAAEHFGKLDVLVNNAGFEGANKMSDDYSLSEWERVFAVNSTGVFLCTKFAIPHMRKNNGGAIVNISSIYGMVGGGDVSAYHASKGAVRAMSKNDAVSFAPENIRVNTIYPGFIPTDMVQRFADDSGATMDEAKPMLDEMHPLGGMGNPDDVAWGVVYLASDEAKWVTGAELVIDGGYTSR